MKNYIARPSIHLSYYGNFYKSPWKLVDKMRADRGKALPWWPEWCFLPLAGAYAIVSAEAKSQGLDITDKKNLSLVNDVGIIGALAAWRVTQGIYRFDPDVYAEVIKTPITGDMPHDIFFNLPEWCVYVETPGLSFLSKPLEGFFASLEYDVNGGRKELRLELDHDTPGYKQPFLISQVIHLGPWSLLESIERSVREAEQNFKNNFGQESPFPNGAAKRFQVDFVPLISLLLYICSVNSEIGNGEKRPIKPRPVKTKKGLRLFPPSAVSTWGVGVRMGAALRKAREQLAEDAAIDVSETEGQPRKSPRPHIRKAHWHGYWTGPMQGDRKFEVRWMPPIPVMTTEDGNELPVTIRPVK